MNSNSNIELINLSDYNYSKTKSTLIIFFKYIIMINIFLIIFMLFIIEKYYSKNKVDLENQKNLNELINIGNRILLKFENIYKNYNNNISEKIKLLKLYTNNNELRYKNFEICLLNNPNREKCIYHLILPKNVVGKKRILIGKKKGDGCYVLLDDLKDIKIAYSFGIKKNVKFDKDLADRGIDIYMYDRTINSLPYNNTKFHWKKIGICGKKRNLKNLKDLETLITENGHSLEKNVILKIDVEHWEWESLNDLSEEILIQFKYIAIEFHFTDESISKESKYYYSVLKKLGKTHQSFYFRCNGKRSRIITFGNNRICHILEVLYIFKKNNIITYDEAIYSISEFVYIPERINGILEMNLNLLKLFYF